jgi:hypothetical protein
MQLQAGAVYLIELCSGEQCRWRLPGSVDVCFAAALASQKASHKARDADNNGLFSRSVTLWMAF